ncbi:MULTISPECIES: DUF4352 domain-containing protein [Rhodococcus]|uniref:DUF4352 domain-containing protein n=1 Tax=Rhodococcus TaxID=1827 RepID=UPI0005741C24|nr:MULTISPECIES: DUF4352 domain-containing protein [Rhodococcus]KHJ72138.1 Mpr protein [Rhodococcus sp. Chr-9]QXF82402.1 DUF4352 domain-containing protein [Rhodococcus pyridinivorans]
MTMPNQPGAPVPPAGYEPAQQKKRKKWPWIVGGIVAVFVIASVSGGGDDDKPSTPAKTDPPAATQADAPVVEEETATMNTRVRDGKFEFVVNGVETGISTLGDNPYLAKEAQGQFVIVTMTVSNISDQPKSLSPSDQKLVDEQGRTFGPDTSAALNLDSDVPIWDQINPGNTVTMPVVFDMPVDAVPTAIELHDSMFSNGVTVSLR